MKKQLWSLSAALAALALLSGPAWAGSPTDYVRGILDRVMAIQNNPTLAGEARQAIRAREIRAVIQKSFDFPLMAKNSLGPVFEGLSPGQRREFVTTFSFLFQDSYTRMVLNFLKQENIKYHGERRTNGQAQVDTSIVRTNETIPVAYFLHPHSQGWLLCDVSVDGVSILENYKSQFAQVIRSQSFEALLNKMKTQQRAVQ
jgi:phospholipid transport system substrate-binding protein